jgi:hypothetical protein
MFQRYVASVLCRCCKSRSGCCICCKCLRGMLQVFQRHVASVCSKYFIGFRRSVSIWMLYMFHTYMSRKSMFEMFQLFQSYVAISVFMLQVTSVLSEYCIRFTHTFQVYVLNVSSASDVCYIPSVLYFKGRESCGTARTPEDGARRARGDRWGVLWFSCRGVRHT